MQRAAAGSAGGAGLDVDEVYSTTVYDGNGTDNRAINNGIDLSGEGGMVWIKNRDFAFDHLIGDTERGITKGIRSNTTAAENNFSDRIKTVTSTGFTIGTADEINSSNTGYTGSLMNYASWTFRKAPKFFDVVTFSTTTGSSTPITVNHNLGSVPGMIIVKTTNITGDWFVFHRSLGSTKYLDLGSTDQAQTGGTSKWASAPTSTSFTLGGDFVQNATYVAYLFAHNNNDGEFGPDADQDVIKCGSFSGSSSSDVTVNVGFEPQWLLTRRTGGGNWTITDNMRGLVTDGIDNTLFADTSGAENTAADRIDLTPTGFIQKSGQTGNETVIYMAIRRGPLAEPESATDVFTAVLGDGSGTPSIKTSNHVTDFGIAINKTGGGSVVGTRLLGTKQLQTHSNNAESTNSFFNWDFMNGWHTWTGLDTNYINYNWRRAPSFCDVVCYTGTGSATTINHNLGVAPEMMWIKRREFGGDWIVYHTGMDSTNPSHKHTELQETNAVKDSVVMFNDTEPTSSVFTIGTNSDVNTVDNKYIAYLFATVSGVSKIGSYTGTGNTQTIDCGFTNGAKFVLTKNITSSGFVGTQRNWLLFDSIRGIVSGNEGYLYLNATSSEQTGSDFIDPHSSGFQLTNAGGNDANASGGTYIFYAIA